MKRKLTNEEVVHTQKAKDNNLQELERLEYYKEYHELMIKKGLFQNFKQQKKEQEAKLKMVLQDIEMFKNHNKILDDQLKNGVEIKNKKSKEE